MGCDIHPHIEFFEATVAGKAKNNSLQARSFASNIDLGRNYTLFSVMAGVRGCATPVVMPRGAPDSPSLSFEVRNCYYANVIDGETSKGINGYSREIANKLVQDGKTVFGDDHQSTIIDPNWHTPSWLTASELIQVRKQYLIEAIEYNYEMKGKRRRNALNILNSSSDIEIMQHVFGDVECPTLNACIASMIAIERSGEYNSRMVFWFDS